LILIEVRHQLAVQALSALRLMQPGTVLTFSQACTDHGRHAGNRHGIDDGQACA